VYDAKAKMIFDEMIREGFIPESGEFEITDFLLEKSYEIGNMLFRDKNKKRSPSDRRFHKKIAGINFLHLNNERADLETKVVQQKSVLKHKSGILYIIENPAFAEFVKVGITRDLSKRLLTYQTYDPYRAFKVRKYIFVQDVKKVERFLLETFNLSDTFHVEWLSVKSLRKIEDFMNTK
jgi:hypothetical protein